MLKKFTTIAVAACALLLATSAATPSPQAAAAPQEEKTAKPAEKRPKDQAEYELINKTFKEQNPQTKLQLLDDWSKKYPESAYKDDRLRLYMRTYQAAGDKEKTIDQAKVVLAKWAGDFEANFSITTLTPTLGKTDEATLSLGAKSAQDLLKGKPDSLTDAQWGQVKGQVTLASHQTLGWIHMQRKDNVEAEGEFKEVLKLSPNAAQVSYWLGNVVLAQGNPDKNELALYSFARASAFEGEGALNEQGRQQVDDYLRKVYSKYTGTEDGLDDLKARAKASPLPPADLKIESAEVRAFKADQKARADNPLLYKYMDLRDMLKGPQGDTTWTDLKGKLTPKMALYVLGSDSARPSRINLGSKPDGPIEVVLNLENRLRAAPGKGRKVTIDGVASTLSKEPFRLTLTGGHVLN